MTKKELSINTKWDEFEMGTCRLFVEVLNQYIPTLFFQDNKPKPTITDKMLQGVNDILSMEMTEFDRLEEVLGGALYKESKVSEIHIDQDNDKFDGVYSEVIIHSAGNVQTSVIVKDGKFACINEGTYFDTLEVSKKNDEVFTPTDEARKKLVEMMMSS